VAQREADYAAQERLGDRGFTPAQRVREAFAQLQSARAALARIRVRIDEATIEAPFAGVVNEVRVEVGEAVPASREVAVLVDNDPLVVAVPVPQQSVEDVRPGGPAAVVFATGREAAGTVSFVSATAEARTRTFRVEVRVPNDEARTPSGISAEVRIPVETVDAHFLSPALLSLGPRGELGVKTVDADDVVRFHPIRLVRTGDGGIWVAGRPDDVRLITVGQGFVRAGERVRVVEADVGDAPPATAGAAEDLRPTGAPGDPSPGAGTTR